ncbi:MAG TPA: DUF86 domain-containing protein [Candidatus Nanoarchaeia archaeon]|nr:DUF86 domain-containing protein [Candidatus Nanoarchaeia archaeon]
MKKDDSVYIRHILDAISNIERSTRSLSKQVFMSNNDVKDATLRRIEVIGEAVKNISEKTKSKHPNIEWKKIAGTRDVIIHSYFNVDWELVWDIVQKDIKELKEKTILVLKDIG